jgi:hypothetical protein
VANLRHTPRIHDIEAVLLQHVRVRRHSGTNSCVAVAVSRPLMAFARVEWMGTCVVRCRWRPLPFPTTRSDTFVRNVGRCSIPKKVPKNPTTRRINAILTVLLHHVWVYQHPGTRKRVAVVVFGGAPARVKRMGRCVAELIPLCVDYGVPGIADRRTTCSTRNVGQRSEEEEG